MKIIDTILTGDCLAILPNLPGYDDRSPEGEYFAWLEEVWSLVQVQ